GGAGAGAEQGVRGADGAAAQRGDDADENESPRGAVHTARRRQAGGRIHVSEREKARAAALARATVHAPAIELRDPPSALTINVLGLWTILRKEGRRVLRSWLQTIIPPAITMTLYFIIFGSL